MALTNAQKQAAHRQRKAAKIARYEAALREIAAMDYEHMGAPRVARNALNAEAEA